MTAVKYVGGLIRGTNAERIALSTTNLRAGWLFVCSDTLDIYYWTGSVWSVITNALGEANTASNVGTGQGVWKAKTGVDLSFRSLTATSSKIALANNTNDIGIDVTEANLTLGNLGGTLGIAKGGTGQTTATAGFDALSPMTTSGDIIYGGASGTRTALAGNITTARQFLSQTGNGSVSAAPAWATPKSLMLLPFGASSATQSVFYGTHIGILVATESLAGLIIDYNFTVKRVRANCSANAKTGSVTMQLRDDSANVTGALVTITAGTTGAFDSGAISVDVAAGSMVDFKYDPTASGTGTITFTCWAECEVTFA